MFLKHSHNPSARKSDTRDGPYSPKGAREMTSEHFSKEYERSAKNFNSTHSRKSVLKKIFKRDSALDSKGDESPNRNVISQNMLISDEEEGDPQE